MNAGAQAAERKTSTIANTAFLMPRIQNVSLLLVPELGCIAILDSTKLMSGRLLITPPYPYYGEHTRTCFWLQMPIGPSIS